MTHQIRAEPAGEVYLSLLAFAERRHSLFSLVWRQGSGMDASAYAVKAALKPFMERQVRTSAWPGTRLIGGSAIVRTYRLVPESTRVLAAAGRLFAWLAPERPEDLAFYTPDGRCWLESIAHEREASVFLDEENLASLLAAVPGLMVSAPRGRVR